ncbi:MAG: N-6 DNA methylase, partial [Clostridiales bacterium]|nr:N-6 DNA methylase [Clostridiales bacterium]
IVESNALEAFPIRQGQLNLSSQSLLLLNCLIERFRDAKQYGSLLHVDDMNLQGVHLLQRDMGQVSLDDLMLSSWLEASSALLPQLIAQATVLAKKYHAVVTNPPYLNKYNPQLKAFMQSEYKDYGADLFSAFIYRNFEFCVKGGYSAFMTPFVWMFIKSYEKLRSYIISEKHISTLIQMEYSAFEEATVPICSFVFMNATSVGKGRYLRLTDFRGGMAAQNERVLEAQAHPDCNFVYDSDQKNYSKIPGSPVAYWLSKTALELFQNNPSFSKIAEPRAGLQTGENDTFLRLWHEIENNCIKYGCGSAQESMNSEEKWYPYSKGGEYRKWYGNYEYVVDWQNDGSNIKKDKLAKLSAGDILASNSKPKNVQYYFREGVTWTTLTSGAFSARLHIHGAIFDIKGSTSFFDNSRVQNYVMAFMNSLPFNTLMKVISPTLDYNAGYIGKMPIKIDESRFSICIALNNSCVAISQADWDSFETSWDFKRHPMVEAMR